MTVLETIVDAGRALPPEKQQELLEFAQLLRQRHGRPRCLRSVGGLCEDLGVDISASEIDQARAELWGAFPRQDI
ncbi:MAG: hypothetical protein HY744_09500 [Deltaproteobacteria bacterium]|nr:hypothetical protein [Deltaproteobacteria bacterium]